MFLYLLRITYRENFDELEVKRDNLKSKFLKQVGQNGMQSTGGGLLFNKVCGARDLPVTGEKEKVGGV